MAFGGNVPDENLVPGFTVQNAGGGTNYSASYVPVVGLTTVASQASAGFPYPPGAINVGSENSGSYAESILTNESYSVSQSQAPAGTNPTMIGAAITLTAAITSGTVPLSPLALMVGSVLASDLVYKIGGETVTITDAPAGTLIPAGAVIVTAPSGAVFVTAAA